MKVKLDILAKDIWENSYLNSDFCPITRALNRAGIDARHTGFAIRNNISNEVILDFDDSEELRGLNCTIYLAYNYKKGLYDIPNEEPKDFSVVLDFDEEKLTFLKPTEEL